MENNNDSFVAEVPDKLCGSCGGTGEVMVPDGDEKSCAYHYEPCRRCQGSGSGKKAIYLEAKRKAWIRKNIDKNKIDKEIEEYANKKFGIKRN